MSSCEWGISGEFTFAEFSDEEREEVAFFFLLEGKGVFCALANLASISMLRVYFPSGVFEAERAECHSGADYQSLSSKDSVSSAGDPAFKASRFCWGGEMISSFFRKLLLQVARSAIHLHLLNQPLPVLKGACELDQPQGAFVSLYKDGSLRGCIGRIVSSSPLWKTVRDMAVAAATRDCRFSPVELGELGRIWIEISVLSPLERLRSVEELQIGRHGLYLRYQEKTGVLLPQVPVKFGWDRVEFLEQTAKKASLPPGWWKKAELFVYEAEVFGEKGGA